MSQDNTSQGPLDNTQPQTLDELFSRDPLDLSSVDLEKIVGELRRQRDKWAETEHALQTKPKERAKITKLNPTELAKLQAQLFGKTLP